jgi:hypothetical protein
MASGDSLMYFDPLANRPPASAYATLDLRGALAVLDFDAAANEAASFLAPMPRHYRGGDLIAELYGTSAETSGNARLRIGLTRLVAASALDPPPSELSSAELVIAAPASAGQLVRAATAPMAAGSLTAGDLLLVSVARMATDGTDTLTSDWELTGIEVREQ